MLFFPVLFMYLPHILRGPFATLTLTCYAFIPAGLGCGWIYWTVRWVISGGTGVIDPRTLWSHAFSSVHQGIFFTVVLLIVLTVRLFYYLKAVRRGTVPG
ncbi:MAG: hypothetical protein ABIP97_02310 [Chthoniobacterales bacterium]